MLQFNSILCDEKYEMKGDVKFKYFYSFISLLTSKFYDFTFISYSVVYLFISSYIHVNSYDGIGITIALFIYKKLKMLAKETVLL